MYHLAGGSRQSPAGLSALGRAPDSMAVVDRAGGRVLLDALINSTELAGIRTIQSGIFPENQASVKLHTGAGFRVVGTRERIGQHGGMWRDVVLIERRSATL